MSKIFTPRELKEFEIRLKGEKKDYNIWYRVKPKLEELLNLFKQKRKIEKLLVAKKWPHLLNYKESKTIWKEIKMDKKLEKKLKRLAKRICPDGSIEWNDFEKLGINVLVMKKLNAELHDKHMLLLQKIHLIGDTNDRQRNKRTKRP